MRASRVRCRQSFVFKKDLQIRLANSRDITFKSGYRGRITLLILFAGLLNIRIPAPPPPGPGPPPTTWRDRGCNPVPRSGYRGGCRGGSLWRRGIARSPEGGRPCRPGSATALKLLSRSRMCAVYLLACFKTVPAHTGRSPSPPSPEPPTTKHAVFQSGPVPGSPGPGPAPFPGSDPTSPLPPRPEPHWPHPLPSEFGAEPWASV